MREALKEAELAFQADEIPAVAVIANLDGRITARAHNMAVSLSDPSAHAEMLSMRSAAARLGNYRLPGLILVSTLEPCSMCLSCAIQSRIRGIVFGAEEPKWGACRSVLDLNSLSQLNHHLEFMEGGVLSGECGDLMRSFFQKRRNKQGGAE